MVRRGIAKALQQFRQSPCVIQHCMSKVFRRRVSVEYRGFGLEGKTRRCQTSRCRWDNHVLTGRASMMPSE